MTTRILLLTHAPLASALRECALHVFADSADDVLALDALVSRAMVGGSQGVMQVASSSRQNQSARPSHDQDQYHHQQ